MADDLVLVTRCLQGDQRAYGDLIDRYQKPIFNVARRTLKDDRDAEDVTQTVFMKAWEHLADFNPRYKFFSWIYRIAVNESINAAKRRRPVESIDSRVDQPMDRSASRFAENDTDREIQFGLLQLSPEDRALVLLKHFEGFSYADIGYIMDISDKTVKSRLYTARQRLRAVLERERSTTDD